MRREQFSNQARTTLSSSLNNSSTSVSVADGSVFPSSGDYHIIIDSEIMLVIARSTNTLTVIRGQESTSAASHNSGSTVGIILTEGSVIKRFNDALGPMETLVAPKKVTAVASDFTWVNQGSSSVADNTWGGITMTVEGTASPHSLRCLVKSAPSTPYSFYAHILGLNQEAAASGSYCGIVFRDSITGELTTVARRFQNLVAVWNWNSPTSFANQPATYDFFTTPNGVWYCGTDNGTNIQFSYSLDGVNYFQMYSASRTAHLTNGPDQIGWFAGNYQGVGVDLPVALNAWSEQ